MSRSDDGICAHMLARFIRCAPEGSLELAERLTASRHITDRYLHISHPLCPLAYPLPRLFFLRLPRGPPRLGLDDSRRNPSKRGSMGRAGAEAARFRRASQRSVGRAPWYQVPEPGASTTIARQRLQAARSAH